MDIELCKKEFFLLDEELESFKDFLNDPTKNIYHSIDGVKIVKSENGELCGVGRFYCDNNDKDNINRKPNTGMIDQYMDYIKFINDNVDEENKIIYDTIMMIGDASGKEGQFSDSDKKTAENLGCEYMDVDDFVYKYNNRMTISYPSIIM